MTDKLLLLICNQIIILYRINSEDSLHDIQEMMVLVAEKANTMGNDLTYDVITYYYVYYTG